MKPNPELIKFIAPYNDTVQDIMLELREFVVQSVPEANELIWDNYNAVAIAYSKSERLKDAFCHIAIYSKHVNFGFNRGAELTIRCLKLLGTGKLIRHITVKNMEEFPKKEIALMIKEAVEISAKRNAQLTRSQSAPKSLVMSISEKKIRPKSKDIK
jgi:hypothetical protein